MPPLSASHLQKQGSMTARTECRTEAAQGLGPEKKNKILKPDLCRSPEFSLYRKKFLFLKTAQQQDKSNQKDIF